MTEEQTETTESTAPSEPAADAATTPGTDPSAASVSPADAGAAARPESLADRPEVLVAGAFAGGLLLALVLRGVGGGD